MMAENVMRKIKIEKVVLGIGGTGDNLEKGVKLLKILTGKKPARMKSNKRIPSLGVRPKLEVGAIVTIRKNAKEFLKRMLIPIDNKLKRKIPRARLHHQVAKNIDSIKAIQPIPSQLIRSEIHVLIIANEPLTVLVRLLMPRYRQY